MELVKESVVAAKLLLSYPDSESESTSITMMAGGVLDRSGGGGG